MMLTFGFTTLIDALSWILVLALSIKLVATVTILLAGKDIRDRPGWGSALWWATKITPVIAVPCFLGLGLLEGDRTMVWLALALAAFVAVALPLKIGQRRNRIAGQTAAKQATPDCAPARLPTI